MTIKFKDLSVLAYANGFTLWHYTTMDTTAEVLSPDYFNEATDMLRVGDMIFTNVDTDNVIMASGVLYVTENGGGKVVVSKSGRM